MVPQSAQAAKDKGKLFVWRMAQSTLIKICLVLENGEARFRLGLETRTSVLKVEQPKPWAKQV